MAAGGNTSYAVTQTGILLAWGDNQNGQMANGRLGKQRNEEKPTRVMDGIDRIYARFGSSAALSAEGDLYCFGTGKWKDYEDGEIKEGTSPIKVMKNVSTLFSMSYALSNDNKLYSLGSNQVIETDVRDYCNTQGTEFVLHTDGTVWGRGKNYSGELGNGVRSNRDSPSVQAAANQFERCFEQLGDIRKICMIIWDEDITTCILTQSGDIYICGFDLQRDSYILKPEKLSIGVDGVVHIAPFQYGLYILTDRNELYIAGNHRFLMFNENKGISNESRNLQWVPVLAMQNVEKVTDGMLLTTDGTAYTFGLQTYMELVGPDVHKWSEALMPYGIGKLICKEIMRSVKDVACSGTRQDNPSYLLVTDGGVLYAWGDNQYGQLGLGDAGTDENIFEIKLPE